MTFRLGKAGYGKQIRGEMIGEKYDSMQYWWNKIKRSKQMSISRVTGKK